MHLVPYVIRKFYSGGEALARYHGVDVSDLCQIGMIGLIKADSCYDVNRSIQFATYAVHKIRSEIRRFIRDNNPSARFPRTIKEIAVTLEDIETMSLQSIMDRTGIDRIDALGVIDYARRKPVSMQQIARHDAITSDTTTFEDLIASQVDTAEEALRNVELQEKMALLNAKAKQICGLILSGDDQATASRKVGISQSRISRHLSNAIKTIEREYSTQ